MFAKSFLLGAIHHHLVFYTKIPAFSMFCHLISKVKLRRPISGMFYLKMPCDLRPNHQRICLKVGCSWWLGKVGIYRTNQNPMVKCVEIGSISGGKELKEIESLDMQGNAGASFGWLGWFLFDIVGKSHLEMADVASHVCLIEILFSLKQMHMCMNIYIYIWSTDLQWFTYLFQFIFAIHVYIYICFTKLCTHIFCIKHIEGDLLNDSHHMLHVSHVRSTWQLKLSVYRKPPIHELATCKTKGRIGTTPLQPAIVIDHLWRGNLITFFNITSLIIIANHQSINSFLKFWKGFLPRSGTVEPFSFEACHVTWHIKSSPKRYRACDAMEVGNLIASPWMRNWWQERVLVLIVLNCRGGRFRVM